MKLGLNITARDGLRAVLIAGFLLLLGANLPGHMSYDSVAQLYEGHFHVRETWGPAIYAWLLGLFDAVIPGTALYVVASALLLFLSLASFSRLRARIGWIGVAVTAAVLLTPQVLIYQAIVWKDVMFANTAVAGVVLMAHAAAEWENARGRWLRGAAWALGLLAAVLLMGQVLARMAEPPHAPPETAMKQGVRIVQHYDLVGAMALDPRYRLDIVRKANPASTAVVESRGPVQYAGDRVDYMDRDETLGAALWALPDDAVRAQWLDLIVRHPALYLKVRWNDFRWVFMTPVVDKCLAVYVGVDAPDQKMKPLGLQHRYVESDVQLANYHSWYLDTPAYSHVASVILALALTGLLALRREPADIAIGALLLAGVGFAASFFIITIACDYRYLYFSDLSALVGLVYVALDFPLKRRSKPG